MSRRIRSLLLWCLFFISTLDGFVLSRHKRYVEIKPIDASESDLQKNSWYHVEPSEAADESRNLLSRLKEEKAVLLELFYLAKVLQAFRKPESWGSETLNSAIQRITDKELLEEMARELSREKGFELVSRIGEEGTVPDQLQVQLANDVRLLYPVVIRTLRKVLSLKKAGGKLQLADKDDFLGTLLLDMENYWQELRKAANSLEGPRVVEDFKGPGYVVESEVVHAYRPPAQVVTSQESVDQVMDLLKPVINNAWEQHPDVVVLEEEHVHGVVVTENKFADNEAFVSVVDSSENQQETGEDDLENKQPMMEIVTTVTKSDKIPHDVAESLVDNPVALDLLAGRDEERILEDEEKLVESDTNDEMPDEVAQFIGVEEELPDGSDSPKALEETITDAPKSFPDDAQVAELKNTEPLAEGSEEDEERRVKPNRRRPTHPPPPPAPVVIIQQTTKVTQNPQVSRPPAVNLEIEIELERRRRIAKELDEFLLVVEQLSGVNGVAQQFDPYDRTRMVGWIQEDARADETGATPAGVLDQAVFIRALSKLLNLKDLVQGRVNLLGALEVLQSQLALGRQDAEDDYFARVYGAGRSTNPPDEADDPMEDDEGPDLKK
ncbi:hypothetical protein ZHAS_00018391 [Anopheles sinensis]|uniref:Uncharacterized protein n=1 Tax=Anopheles sinensis TaxID=74873 RepID=A0A084WHP3_ANOSI|nr:hypothetical protein ZHAS_00018391 [Anopheles sinensis]